MNKATITANGKTVTIEQAEPIDKDLILKVLTEMNSTPAPIVINNPIPYPYLYPQYPRPYIYYGNGNGILGSGNATTIAGLTARTQAENVQQSGYSSFTVN